MVVHVGAGRLAGIYTALPLDDARALFMFRSKVELDYLYREALRQKELLRAAFAGMHATVEGWLNELDRTPAVLLRLDHPVAAGHLVARAGHAGWCDVGYCPGPAVGGSTSLSVLGAYVLAGELAQAGGVYTRAFAAS